MKKIVAVVSLSVMLTGCSTTGYPPGDPCNVFKCQNGAMLYESDGGIGGTAYANRVYSRSVRITDSQGRTTGYIK